MITRHYFDHNATTPLCDEALQALSTALREVYGNASSIHHYGQAAKQRLETARRQAAALLCAGPKDITFLSGGTEANNLALFGTARPGAHVITTAIEHPAVLNPCGRLEEMGVAVTYIPPDRAGLIDPEDVRRALRPDTALVSVMHANNETGVIQPVEAIAAIVHGHGALFHIDGVQAVGKIPVDVNALGADLYSVSAHKFGAPKGIGGLYVRPKLRLQPQILGGHHERDRRAGTENVPSAIAFGAAAQAAKARGTFSLSTLRDRLEAGILAGVPGAAVNGARAPRLPNTSNLLFPDIGGEAMVIALDLRGFAVSSGSACSSGAVEPSHVLLAMGLSPEQARSSVRFSLGPTNTAEEVDALIDATTQCAAHLRRLSPTYTHA